MNEPKKSIAELFAKIGQCLQELRELGVIRGHANPSAEYAEWLVAAKIGATRAAKNQKGWDLFLPDGCKIQVEHQQKAPNNGHAKYWCIKHNKFEGADKFAFVEFEPNFDVRALYLIDRSEVSRIGKYREKYSDWQLRLNDLKRHRLA